MDVDASLKLYGFALEDVKTRHVMAFDDAFRAARSGKVVADIVVSQPGYLAGYELDLLGAS